MLRTRQIQTPLLEIACAIEGPENGLPVVLLHGFPYDPHSFDQVVLLLAAAGCRTVVPCLRGFGATRFRADETMRSGEQAAIGCDLLQLLDALHLPQAILAGFDWGARAGCIVAALWPERVLGLLSCCGYQLQERATAGRPALPEQEWRFWYQYYFHTERGRAGLTEQRSELCRFLWQLWSPTWQFTKDEFERTAASFANPDFVDVVIHSYRHRLGNASGDPRYAEIEVRLAAMPTISIPAISLHGMVDGVVPLPFSEGHEKYFKGVYERRLLANIGHNPPQEAPEAFVRALLDLC